MQKKTAIIFDFGGVLLDWNPRHLFREYFEDEAAMEQFLEETDFNTWNVELDKGRSFAQGVADLSDRFPHYARLITAYDEQWEKSTRGPIQATVDLLLPLKENGYTLHGLTNFSNEKFQFVRHNYPFFELFDTILVSAVVGLVKPDPRIYALLLQQIDRSARECIFIDDSLPNISAARALGFTGIHFRSPEQLRNELTLLGIEY